jgi:putative transposase
MRQQHVRGGMAALCAVFGKSRQGYYTRQQVQRRRLQEATQVLQRVRKVREHQPYVGGRKLQRHLGEHGLCIGRDRLFDLLRTHRLLVRRQRRTVQTTDSRHGRRTYPNQVQHLVSVAPGQAVVADITYLRTREGFGYLSLVTDLGSRKILGYAVHPRLTTTGPLRAIRQALAQIARPAICIHHSDRGVQYCSQAYIQTLQQAGMTISMTEEDHVYENAVAERVNGILKQEFGLGEILPSVAAARHWVAEAVRIYNQERLHMALDYQTPEAVYATAV